MARWYQETLTATFESKQHVWLQIPSHMDGGRFQVWATGELFLFSQVPLPLKAWVLRLARPQRDAGVRLVAVRRQPYLVRVSPIQNIASPVSLQVGCRRSVDVDVLTYPTRPLRRGFSSTSD